MDIYIFSAFLIVLVIGYTIDRHRKQTSFQPEVRAEEHHDWRYYALALALIVGLLVLFNVFVEPWIERHIPGPNTAWIMSIVLATALFIAAPALARRFTRPS